MLIRKNSFKLKRFIVDYTAIKIYTTATAEYRAGLVKILQRLSRVLKDSSKRRSFRNPFFCLRAFFRIDPQLYSFNIHLYAKN